LHSCGCGEIMTRLFPPHHAMTTVPGNTNCQSSAEPVTLTLTKLWTRRRVRDSKIWRRRKQLGVPPPFPITRKEGSLLHLKCLTPEEAWLVAQELEKEDIVASVPDTLKMGRQCRKNGCSGYTEVSVSARAYEMADPELRASVEFQHYLAPESRPLNLAAMIAGIGAGFTPLPGALAFAWIFTGYLNSGQDRKARQFLSSYLAGCAALVGCIVVGMTLC